MKTVIIPTLNEEENIGNLIEQVLRVLDAADSIIIVDDDSQDNTQGIVRSHAEKDSRVQLIVRNKERGLSTAVRKGAESVSSGYVAVMDADFSHNPRFLPALFKALDDGNDIAIGSRYVKGGCVVDWPIQRILVSRIAILLAQILLRIRIKDPMSGFVACRSARILVNGIRHADYKFLLEIVAKYPHLRITEVPIIFRDRMLGKSKLKGSTILRYLDLVFKLLRNRTGS